MPNRLYVHRAVEESAYIPQRTQRLIISYSIILKFPLQCIRLIRYNIPS